jgi:hypothetical protein
VWEILAAQILGPGGRSASRELFFWAFLPLIDAVVASLSSLFFRLPFSSSPLSLPLFLIFLPLPFPRHRSILSLFEENFNR